MANQGWKLQAVRLSGTGKNRAGQVEILGTFPKERLKLWILLSVYLSRTGKNSARQVDFFDTFPKERLNSFVISTPANTDDAIMLKGPVITWFYYINLFRVLFKKRHMSIQTLLL